MTLKIADLARLAKLLSSEGSLHLAWMSEVLQSRWKDSEIFFFSLASYRAITANIGSTFKSNLNQFVKKKIFIKAGNYSVDGSSRTSHIYIITNDKAEIYSGGRESRDFPHTWIEFSSPGLYFRVVVSRTN